MNVVEHHLLIEFVATANPGENGPIWAAFLLGSDALSTPLSRICTEFSEGEIWSKNKVKKGSRISLPLSSKWLDFGRTSDVSFSCRIGDVFCSNSSGFSWSRKL